MSENNFVEANFVEAENNNATTRPHASPNPHAAKGG
jgi:hypothetical protein